MFRNDYKKAYDKIGPNQDQVERLLSVAREERGQTYTARTWKPAAAVIVCCICIWNVLPVCAANIPSFYRVIEAVSPGIADLFVPVEESSKSQGITMQVEAVNLDENQAEILVSFQGEEGVYKINGKADIFDGYGLESYTGSSWIGGCQFLRYDADTDKAYFMISVQSEEPFEKNKLVFYVNSFICGITEEERDIDLSVVRYGADTKNVTVSGSGGSGDISPYSEVLLGENVDGGPRKTFRVLSADGGQSRSTDDFTVTGIAYQDDVLRVQICMGDNTEADRHVQPFLLDQSGVERHEDYSVSWSEMAGDTRLTYYEYYFFGPFHNLENYKMYGIFHGSGEVIGGEWSVTFRLEP